MSRVARFAIEQPLYTWILMLVCIAGGLWGIDTVGRLEDPAFPIKHAYIITSYPGASAVEVEQEVTDTIEAALQELPYLDHMESKSVPGRSEIQVEMIESLSEAEIPQVWDELRRRVREAAMRLPPGAGEPLVEDDFGDVYGILYAVTAPGFPPADIAEVSRTLRTALKQVPGVAKISSAGEPAEAIFVEVAQDRLARLGLPVDQLFASLATENQIIGAGSIRHGDRRLRLAPEQAFQQVAAVADMRIGRPGTTEILRLGDIAEISRGPREVQLHRIRYQGQPAFTIGVSVVKGENVVDVGRRVDARMGELAAALPLGMDVHTIYAQHNMVQRAIADFLQNLALSVATVVAALCLFMGWRAGIVVGSVLLLTVLGTLYVMALLGIELQRISLGALMIAMGMLVDNGIVIAEGMVVGVRQGQSPADAAARSVQRTQFPLLGATLIGILAFAPIGLSDDNSGYFLRSLFQVVAISLTLSWILAISVVPLLGSHLLKRGAMAADTAKDVYSGWAYAPYRRALRFGLRRAWFTSLVIVGITAACFWAFQFVKPGFFPSNNVPLFFVDAYLPQGTDLDATTEQVAALESLLGADPAITAVTSFVGRGATRFNTVYRPEQPNSAYAQLVVRVADVAGMNTLMSELRSRLVSRPGLPELQLYRLEFTPSGNSKIEARFSGPDARVLRSLASQALDVYLAHDLIDRKTNWRTPALEMVPRFDETRARSAGVSRQDLARTLAFATNGVSVGLFRDGHQLIPIIARAPEAERGALHALGDRLIWSPAQQVHVPVSQVVPRFELSGADDLIWRRDRVRTIKALANPPPGHNPTRAFNRIRGQVEAIPLPPGYQLTWGGEYEGSQDANRLLLRKIPLTFGIMLFITILMFGQLKQPLVIWLTVPMCVCGVVIALLATDLTFTFPAFLGFLSLSGMLIKNCIVLVDEIDKQMAERGHTLEVMAQASVSRLRPVVLATGTTIAGMSPLLADAFFQEMAVGIMGGLAFATVLTLMAVPVFYRIALGRQVIAS